MGRVIWKYPLNTGASHKIEIPSVRKVLCVQMQNKLNQPCLWVEVDPDSPVSELNVITRGTGHEYMDDAAGVYLGSYQNGPFVYHVYIE